MSKKKDKKNPVEELQEFHLSRMEFYYLDRLMNNRYLGMVMNPMIYREYELAWGSFDEYPFRQENESPVIGVLVELMPL